MAGVRFSLVGLAALIASCAGFPDDPPSPEVPFSPDETSPASFESRLLATIPEDLTCEGFQVNRPGTAAAYLGRKNEQFFVVHTNIWSPPLDAVHGPWLSDDGAHVAYLTGRGTFVVDGRPWDADGVIVDVTSSPDGVRFAAIGKKGFQVFVIIDGRRSEDFDYVSRPAFSPDGRQVAYAARTGQRQWVVLNGRKQMEHEPYESVLLIGRANAPLEGPWKRDVTLPQPVFSADGHSLAYPAARNGKRFVVVDGREGEPFDEVLTPIWSPQGKRLAHVARRERMWCVVIDGVRGEFFDHVPEPLFSPNPVFSADGSTLAYLASREKRQFLVIERRGRREIPYTHAYTAALSPRGTRSACVAATEAGRTFKGALGNAFVVVDGRAGPEFDRVDTSTIVFSPDGTRFAYEKGSFGPAGEQQAIVVDHSAGEGYGSVRKALFSPDSRHVVHWATRGRKEHLVIDGDPGEPYDEIQISPIVFSRDSKQVAFGARRGRELWWVVRKL